MHPCQNLFPSSELYGKASIKDFQLISSDQKKNAKLKQDCKNAILYAGHWEKNTLAGLPWGPQKVH